MKKTPYVFKNRKELLKLLQSKTTRAHAKEFFAKRLPDIESVVLQSIAGNTFRAFQKLPERPSIVFRTWASVRLHLTLETLKSITDHQSYADYVHYAAQNLCKTWLSTMHKEIGYGRSTKLINLVLKKLACLEGIDESFRKRIIKYQHVPLDSYTIVGLKKLIPNLAIKKNSTMKFIEKPSDYRMVQRYISDVAMEAGVPPIYYDILAWDMSHEID